MDLVLDSGVVAGVRKEKRQDTEVSQLSGVCQLSGVGHYSDLEELLQQVQDKEPESTRTRNQGVSGADDDLLVKIEEVKFALAEAGRKDYHLRKKTEMEKVNENTREMWRKSYIKALEKRRQKNEQIKLEKECNDSVVGQLDPMCEVIAVSYTHLTLPTKA